MRLTQAPLPVRLSPRDPANFDLCRRCQRERPSALQLGARNWITSAQNMTVVIISLYRGNSPEFSLVFKGL